MKAGLRILHVLDHSIPLQSGYSFRTLAILREQRRLGWHTFHLTSPKHTAPGASEEEIDGLHFFRTSWEPGPLRQLPIAREMSLMRATARRLLQVARQTGANVLQAHSPVLNAIPALWIGRRLRLPVVYEVRAFWEDAAVDHGTTAEWGLRYRLTRLLETIALERAAAVTTICDGLKREITARGIPHAKVTVIPNAVDPGAFRYGMNADVELKAQLGLQECTVIGFIGSFYAYEGLDLLVAALPKILQRVPNVRLLLVGGGPQQANLTALAATLGIANRVIFTGRIPHEQIQRYYSIIDLFAYPRRSMRLTELVTPLKPLETMAHGGLVVASDVGGHRELIRDGHTGVLFRAGDADCLVAALLRLMMQPERWPSLKIQARRFVEEERNWQTSVSRYRDVFSQVGLQAQ